MYERLENGQYLYRTPQTVSLMPEVALLFDRHSGKLLAHGHVSRVHGRYVQLAIIAQRVGHPELEQCMVYWEGRFDPDDLNRALYSPDYLKHWYDRCSRQAEAITLALLARIEAMARRTVSSQRSH